MRPVQTNFERNADMYASDGVAVIGNIGGGRRADSPGAKMGVDLVDRIGFVQGERGDFDVEVLAVFGDHLISAAHDAR